MSRHNRTYGPRYASTAVARAIEEYRLRVEDAGLSVATSRNYACHVRHFIEWCADDRRLTPARMKAYCESLTAGGISDGKRRAVRTALRYFVRFISPRDRQIIDIEQLLTKEDQRLRHGRYVGYRQARRERRRGLEA